MRERLVVILVIVVLVCLGILTGWVVRQNAHLAETLDVRHVERSAQIDTLLCVAKLLNPTRDLVDACFVTNGLEVP